MRNNDRQWEMTMTRTNYKNTSYKLEGHTRPWPQPVLNAYHKAKGIGMTLVYRSQVKLSLRFSKLKSRA